MADQTSCCWGALHVSINLQRLHVGQSQGSQTPLWMMIMAGLPQHGGTTWAKCSAATIPCNSCYARTNQAAGWIAAKRQQDAGRHTMQQATTCKPRLSSSHAASMPMAVAALRPNSEVPSEHTPLPPLSNSASGTPGAALVRLTAEVVSVSPRRAAMALSQHIQGCCTWQDLQLTWSHLSHHMNAVHVAAVLVKAAKLDQPSSADPAQVQAFNTFVGGVLAAVPGVLPSCGAREATSVAWAAAKLGAMPVDLTAPRSQSRQLTAHSSGTARPPPQPSQPAGPAPVTAVMQYSGFVERQQADGPGGMRAQVVLPTSWWEGVMQRCSEVLPTLNGQDMSMMLWAVVTLQGHQEHQQAGQHPVGYSTGGGSMGAEGEAGEWARSTAHDRQSEQLRTWRRILPPGFLLRVLEQARPRLDTFSPQALSGVIWALARLRLLPDSDWQQRFLAASSRQLGRSAPQALANTAWALAVMETCPPAPWLSAFLSSSAACAARAPPASLSQLLWAAARLPQFTPPAEWVAAMCAAAGPQLTRFSSQDIANLLWAAAALGHHPPAQWMQAVVAGLVRGARGAQPLELSAALSALAKLRYHPGEQVLLQLAGMVVTRKASAQAVCNTLWALATLRTPPGPPLMQAALSSVSLQLEDVGPQELAQLWWALGSLHARPPLGLVSELREELLRQRDVMQPQELAMVLSGHARLGVPLAKPLLDSFTSQVLAGVKPLQWQGPAAQATVARTTVLVLTALARMAHRSRGAQGLSQATFVSALLRCCAQRVQAATPSRGDASSSGKRRRADKQHAARPGLQFVLVGWRPQDVAMVLHAMAELRLCLPTAWAVAALHGLGVPQGRERDAVDGTSAAALVACAVCRLHVRLPRAGMVAPQKAEGQTRGTRRSAPAITAPATGVPLYWWARALAPRLALMGPDALRRLPPARLSSLCWALSYLAARCCPGTEATVTAVRQQLMAAYWLAMQVVLQRAAAAELDAVQLSLVLGSLARLPGRHRQAAAGGGGGGGGDVHQAATRLLQCSVAPSRRASPDAQPWCRMLAAVGRLQVAAPDQWLLLVCSTLQRHLAAHTAPVVAAPAVPELRPQRRQVQHVGLTSTDCDVCLAGLRAVLQADRGPAGAGQVRDEGVQAQLRVTGRQVRAMRDQLVQAERQARSERAMRLLVR